MIKVKIIGAGSIGNHHTQASRAMGWDVTVTDADPKALERMREPLEQLTSIEGLPKHFDAVKVRLT